MGTDLHFYATGRGHPRDWLEERVRGWWTAWVDTMQGLGCDVPGPDSPAWAQPGLLMELDLVCDDLASELVPDRYVIPPESMLGSGVYLAPGAALGRVRRIARAEGSAWAAGSLLEAAAIDALTQRVLDDSVPYMSSNPNGQLLPAHLAQQSLRPSPELRPRGRRRWHRFPRVHQLPAEVPEDVRRLWGFLHTGRSFREGWGELCHEDIHGRSFGWYAEADCQRLLHGLEGLAERPLVGPPGTLSAEQVALAEDIGRNLLAAVASDRASAAASPESIARGVLSTFEPTEDPRTFDLVRAVAAEALEAGGGLVFMAR